MSSANNHKRHTLEEEFQRRLFDAEAKPAPDLWARIDHDLTVQENQDYKKRILVYRQLAAACFVLFALTGSLLAYYYNGSQNGGVTQQGMAALPSTDNAGTTHLTPEAAMEAYVRHEMEPAVVAKASANDDAAPAQSKRQVDKTVVSANYMANVAASSKESTATYYNASPGYSAYLGYGGGATSGRLAGFAGNGWQGNGTTVLSGGGNTAGNRYGQLITWESVTVTFSVTTPRAGRALPGNSNLAAQPKSFAEMSQDYQAARQQQAQQSATAQGVSVAAEKTVKAEADAKASSRWSLNLAYAPASFEQNIGLPDPLTMSPGQGTMFRHSAGPSVNASEESYQNMTAAREEFEESTEPAFSYAVEAKAGFRLKEKLKLLTGIGFSESVARTKSNYLVRQFWVKPRTNEHYELSPSTFFVSSLNNGFTADSVSVARTGEAFATEYKYRHLSIPVGLQYEHDIANDWFLYAAGGVAANFLIESSVRASNQEVQPVSYSTKDSDSPFRNVQLSSNASMGVGKRVSPNLTLAMGPELRNYFSTLVADPENASAPQGRPYAIGLNMSLNYQLGSVRK